MILYKSHKNLYFKYLLILLISVTLLCGSQKSIANAPVSKFIMIEIVGSTAPAMLVQICKQNGIPLTSIYQWTNHLVVFGKLDQPERLLGQIAIKYPKCELKIYKDPFYDFERSRCSDGKIAKDWDNIILTANLVADPKMQQEYLNYHATQFEKWPEVSQGFCNASFQQLLVFKNGRQLMLIISIPKGESLDKLNPLTTKNNPRVDEWNKIMAKYQEGIDGTKKGETWVFLKHL